MSGGGLGLRLLSDTTHGVDERGEVVTGRRGRLEIRRQSNDLPTQRCSQILRVFLAQIIRVGVGDGRQGADNDRRITVVVGQGGDGGRRAAGLRAVALGNHVPKSTTLCARMAHSSAPCAYPEGVFSTRRHISSRNRHGRGPRGPLFFPGTPAWRTRREDFDSMVSELVTELIRRWPQVSTIEFAVEDVPPSEPAPWESHSVVVARIFPADRRRGLRDRIVVYRLPITLRCPPEGIAMMTRRVLVERISHILALPPDEIDEAMR